MTAEFSGIERIGLELSGTVPKEAASDCAGGGLSLDSTSGRVPVSLVLLALDGVHAEKVQQVRFTYVEALWKIGVLVRDRPTWLVYSVDVDKLVPRLLAGFVMSYPTRAAGIHLKDTQRQIDVVLTAEGKTMIARVETHTATPSRGHDKKKLIVRHGPKFYEVPWNHEAPGTRVAASAKVSVQDLAEETFGHGVAWDEEAVLWRGRKHGCGRPIELPVV